MLLKDYIESAKNFSEETKAWGNLNEYAYYTTTGNSWEESCDNASGGIDISWAFHESAEKIEIMTTRQTGGLTTGYKPLILASASRRWLSLCSSHIALFSFAAPVRGVLNTSYP